MSVFLEFRERSELWTALNDVFGKRRNVVDGLNFSSHGVLHGFVDSVSLLFVREAVDSGFLEVLCLGVNLELTGNSLEDVEFPSGQVLVDDHRLDNAVLQVELKRLAADGELLISQFLLRDLSTPSTSQVGVNIGVLSFMDLETELVVRLGLNLKFSLHDDSNILVSHLMETSEGTTSQPVSVLTVAFPSMLPSGEGSCQE